MRKTLGLITGMLLCMVLSGCSGQGDSADGDQQFSLQDMAVDTVERETLQGENAAETGVTADGKTAEKETSAVGGSAPGTSVHRETVEIETSAVDGSAPETPAGMTEGNNTDKTQLCEPETKGISNRDLEEIKEYLAQFPNTLQELSEAECYVILHGNEHSGREYLNAFIENVKAGNPGELVFVQFTTEGAPILTYLNYDGENVYCVEDISRDGFAGGNGEKYFEKYYDSIWLRAYSDAEGNCNMSLRVLWEEDMVLDLFTAHTEESVMCELPPWAKPPAP